MFFFFFFLGGGGGGGGGGALHNVQTRKKTRPKRNKDKNVLTVKIFRKNPGAVKWISLANDSVLSLYLSPAYTSVRYSESMAPPIGAREINKLP